MKSRSSPNATFKYLMSYILLLVQYLKLFRKKHLRMFSPVVSEKHLAWHLWKHICCLLVKVTICIRFPQQSNCQKLSSQHLLIHKRQQQVRMTVVECTAVAGLMLFICNIMKLLLDLYFAWNLHVPTKRLCHWHHCKILWVENFNWPAVNDNAFRSHKNKNSSFYHLHVIPNIVWFLENVPTTFFQVKCE